MSGPWLEVADRIGARLCRDAVWSGARCNWLGWAVEQRRQFNLPVYRAQGPSLHDGVAGIALFLAELLRFTGDPLQRATALGALEQVAHATADPDFRQAPGFHRGHAGIASAFIRAGEAIGDERWVARGYGLLAGLRGTAPDPTRPDVASGSAGTILGLLEAAAALARDDLAAAARTHGEALMRTATRDEAGWRWSAAPRPGYAHGGGGIAAALLALGRATAEERYHDAAQQALRLDRAPPAETTSWSDGPCAIGFARLHLHGQLEGEAAAEVERELDAALADTEQALTRPFAPGQGFCLELGAAGLAELLLDAAARLRRPELRQVAEAVGQTGITHFHATDIPWPGGVPVRGETPNLMLGLAGIGHFYLRLHATPEAVPSVPPRRARRLRPRPAGSGGGQRPARRPPPWHKDRIPSGRRRLSGQHQRSRQGSSERASARPAPAESFVSKIVSDPGKVPGVYMLSGFLGDAGQADYRRLYVTPDLSQWLEIPSDALLHSEPMPGPGAWPGTVIVWVRQDAQLLPGNRFSGTAGR